MYCIYEKMSTLEPSIAENNISPGKLLIPVPLINRFFTTIIASTILDQNQRVLEGFYPHLVLVPIP